MCLYMTGGGEGFRDTTDDRSCTACFLIIATAGGCKVLKEVKRKAVFINVDKIRGVIRKKLQFADLFDDIYLNVDLLIK